MRTLNEFRQEIAHTILQTTLFLSILLFVGCVATSNYYSAQVLDEDKFAVTIGVDDIFIESNDESIRIKNKSTYSPSVAVAYGFPYRIEGNLRYFPPRFTELTIRHQVNPESFDIVDGSVNLHIGHVFGGYTYLKYGVTVSKDIHDFEPFVHYSAYSFLGANKNDATNDYLTGFTDDFINHNRVIGFGVGIPIRKGKLFPEVDYQYFGKLETGLWHFGIGLRINIE